MARKTRGMMQAQHDKVIYKWAWCNQCDCAAIICPHCGNNCCNGMCGEDLDGEKCRHCSDAYDYQRYMYTEETVPGKEQIIQDGGIVIPSLQEILDSVKGE